METIQLIKYRNGKWQWKIPITKLTTSKLIEIILAVKSDDFQIKRKLTATKEGG
jgi:hypothetical protein